MYVFRNIHVYAYVSACVTTTKEKREHEFENEHGGIYGIGLEEGEK